MKAAVWNDKGSLDIVERPTGEPKPGQVRIRVSSVGICGTDLHFYRGSFPSPAGLLPGHEIGGLIDAVGEGVALQAGTAVAVEPQTFCGECYQCRTGNHNRCAKRVLLGVTGRGGCAEMATVPAYTLYPLPQGVSLRWARWSNLSQYACMGPVSAVSSPDKEWRSWEQERSD
jgi:D-arabinose 1-dehydrogenase-like Zn-dependent alcohol dehydrogenase